MHPKEPQLDDDFARDYAPGDYAHDWQEVCGIDRPEDMDEYLCEGDEYE